MATNAVLDQPPSPPSPMTVEAFERWLETLPDDAEDHELIEGIVCAKGQTSVNHDLIVGNVSGTIFGQLKPPCRFYGAGRSVAIDRTSQPRSDGLVSCESVENNEIKAPVIVIEVLSPSTKGRDLSDKLWLYERVGSIRHYLAIEQNRAVVYHFHREDDGLFQPRLVRKGTLRLDPPGVALEVEEIYAGVVFPPEEPIND